MEHPSATLESMKDVYSPHGKITPGIRYTYVTNFLQQNYEELLPRFKVLDLTAGLLAKLSHMFCLVMHY
jgi:hypothetical protein